jgi:MFS family permease
MLAVLFLLGIHACFLDPAKEGILPQIFPDEALSRANGLMQLTVYTMIVSGPVAAGLLLDAFLSKPYIPVAMLVGMALLGLLVATGISRVPRHRRRREIPHGTPFGSSGMTSRKFAARARFTGPCWPSPISGFWARSICKTSSDTAATFCI